MFFVSAAEQRAVISVLCCCFVIRLTATAGPPALLSATLHRAYCTSAVNLIAISPIACQSRLYDCPFRSNSGTPRPHQPGNSDRSPAAGKIELLKVLVLKVDSNSIPSFGIEIESGEFD
jgi:hypothetical protein